MGGVGRPGRDPGDFFFIFDHGAVLAHRPILGQDGFAVARPDDSE